MTRSANHPWLCRYAVGTAAAALLLISAGGLVTSHEAGMAVPDWPTTYGDHLFFFPASKWVGGIFYEHTHRLLAAGVGVLTAILAGWIWGRETTGWPRRVGLTAIVATLGLMGVRTQGMFIALALVAVGVIIYSVVRLAREERPLRWLAAIAFSAVLIQGVLGGLRVTEMKDEIGIFHGAFAQLFFTLLCAMALFTSRWWADAGREKIAVYERNSLRYAYLLTSGMILLQLILGATMRHQHAGLAIPDFPLAYGKLWPDMDAGSVAHYNQLRLEMNALNPITPFQIALQMAHRLGAAAILVGVLWAAWLTQRRLGWRAGLTKLAFGWLALIVAQAALGAATIWSKKSPDVATAHVMVGTLSLATGALLFLMATRRLSNAIMPDTALKPARPTADAGEPLNLPA